MRVFKTTLIALAVVVSSQPATRAQQNLAFSVFERSLEQLRQESGIPGLSAVIVSGGGTWERGFGMADVEAFIAAAPDTPYPVGDLTQTLAATLVLQCIDRGHLQIRERMERWTSLIPEQQATVGDVLRHTSTGVYAYDPVRFAALTPVVEYCHMRVPFKRALAREILDPLVMRDSVPGHDMEAPSSQDATLFAASDIGRYQDVLRRMAVPYRVDIRRRATRSEYPARAISGATGLIASARDLGRFDSGFAGRGLLTEEAKAAMFQRGGASVPTGLGWFVQPYNNETLIWHFGHIPNAFSSLIIKVPGRGLTLILLANSDGLSAPFALQQGDVTASLFARTFLRTFLP